jgi:thioredoxin-related protein
MAPIVDGLIPEYEGSVAIRTYDVETSADAAALAGEYGVQYVPTFVFLDGEGENVNVIIGEVSESELKDALDELE